MSKSIASVVHQDGQRVKLDDYLHKNTHLIVGTLASERYPDEWDAEAKVVRPEEPEEDDAEDWEDEATEDLPEEAGDPQDRA